MKRTLALLVPALLLAACASYPDLPEGIRTPPSSDLSLTDVRESPDSFRGREVRWGGTILDVRNQAEHSWVEVLAYPLQRSGRPDTDGQSDGRFFGRVPQFLDPAVYTRGRQITVTGSLGESVVQQIGDHEYRYPVVEAEAHYLWPPERERRPVYYYDYPFYRYDVWFYYGRPYFRPHPYYW